jgi:hypothetical protein
MKSLALAVVAALVGLAAGLGFSVLRLGLPSSGDPFDNNVLRPVASESLDGEPQLTIERKNAPPGVQIDNSSKEYSIDFGVMPQHTAGSAEFIFRNVGRGPLELSKGRASCQCTVGELSETKVAPGGETIVRLSWKTEGAEGPFRHYAEIRTNDPRRPEINFVITGTLTRGLVIDPPTVALGNFSMREPKQAQFAVTAYHNADLKIDGCTLASESNESKAKDDPLAKHVEFSITPLPQQELQALQPPAKSGYRVSVSVKPGLPHGRFERKIRLTTNLFAPQEIPLIGTVLGDVSVALGGGWVEEWQVFRLGEADAGQGMSKQLYLLVTGKNFRNVQVKVKRTIPSELQATVGEPRPGNEVVRWPITIAIPPGVRPMSHVEKGEYGQVILETTNPDHKEFIIPVSFLVTKARS